MDISVDLWSFVGEKVKAFVLVEEGDNIDDKHDSFKAGFTLFSPSRDFLLDIL